MLTLKPDLLSDWQRYPSLCRFEVSYVIEKLLTCVDALFLIHCHGRRRWWWRGRRRLLFHLFASLLEDYSQPLFLLPPFTLIALPVLPPTHFLRAYERSWTGSSFNKSFRVTREEAHGANSTLYEREAPFKANTPVKESGAWNHLCILHFLLLT